MLPLSLESRVPSAAATALFFLLAYLLFLGKNRLLGLDEAMYAKAALGAARDGHWLPMFFEGSPFWEKPPLVLWLQGLALSLLGPKEEAVRLGSALAGAGTLYFVHRLGDFFGKSRWAGFACALLLGLQPHFILYSRLGTMDMPLLLCLTGAWWSLVKAFTRGEGRDRALLEAGLWGLLGVWIKSWFGLILLPSALVCLVWLRPDPTLRKAFLERVLLPCALAVAAWLLLYRLVYGNAFFEWEFGHNVRSRVGWGFLGWPLEGGYPFRFYGSLAQEGLAFLWPILPLASRLWVGQVLQRRKDLAFGAAALLGCLFFAYYLFFLTGFMAPLINYILPLVPVGAVALAFLLAGGGQAGGWAGAVFLLAALNGLLGFSAWELVLPASLLLAAGAGWKLPWPHADRGLAVFGFCFLLAASAWKAQHYLQHPPDPNRVWVEAVLLHPARVPGERLLFVGEHTDARVLGFYSGYDVKALDRMPEARPAEALLFQEGARAVFLPPAVKNPGPRNEGDP